jgi:hypothetical protein
MWRYCERPFRADVPAALVVSCPVVAGAVVLPFCPAAVEPAADVAALHGLELPALCVDPLPFQVVVGAPGDPVPPVGGAL